MDIELLEKAKAASRTLEPADLHGTVCGMAAGRPHTFSLPELIELLGTDALEDSVTLEDFVGDALDALHAQDLEFHPLMPDDDEPIADRLGGLAAWTAGFLTGFGSVVQGALNSLPAEVGEVLRDYASISGIDEEEAESKANEASFMELYEYVRVSAVLVMALMTDHLDAGSVEHDEVEH